MSAVQIHVPLRLRSHRLHMLQMHLCRPLHSVPGKNMLTKANIAAKVAAGSTAIYKGKTLTAMVAEDAAAKL